MHGTMGVHACMHTYVRGQGGCEDHVVLHMLHHAPSRTMDTDCRLAGSPCLGWKPVLSHKSSRQPEVRGRIQAQRVSGKDPGTAGHRVLLTALPLTALALAWRGARGRRLSCRLSSLQRRVPGGAAQIRATDGGDSSDTYVRTHNPAILLNSKKTFDGYRSPGQRAPQLDSATSGAS